MSKKGLEGLKKELLNNPEALASLMDGGGAGYV